MPEYDEREYARRAELRGVGYGHRAWVNDDGSIKVVSESRPGHHHRVTFSASTIPDVPIVFACSCEAGTYRREPVPCWHSAIAARRLEREGLAVWRDGLWYSTLAETFTGDDPTAVTRESLIPRPKVVAP